MSFFARFVGKALTVGLIAATMAAPALPALASPEEAAFLQSYIGGWKGTGELIGGAEKEAFTCRVNVTKGQADKINYAGRCSVAGLNLSVAGTIAYVDANSRYEAAMTSNATFSGTAIGKKQGKGVVFDLKERDTDEKGNDMTISSQISLEGDNMGLKFKVVFNDTGDESNASVTFARLP